MHTAPPNVTANAQFKDGFQVFIKDLAAFVGIADLKRVLGVGIKNLARLMSLELVPQSQPSVSYRQIIFQIFNILIQRPPELLDPLLVDMLRMTRAIVYMDDPRDTNHTLQEQNWENFVNDALPEKSEPKREVYSWVQTKIVRLGGIVASGVNMSHPNPAVSSAALRLGVTLMQHGNREAQDILYEHLQTTRDTLFFGAVESVCVGAITAIKEWRLALKKQAEILSKQGTPANSPVKREDSDETGSFQPPPPTDPDTKACASNLNQCFLMLRYLQLTMEGHYEPFQHYIREQPQNVKSYGLVVTMTELLTTISNSLEFCFANQYGVLFPLLRQLFACLTEMLQGSCYLNQVECSSNYMMILFRRIFSILAYSPEPGVDDMQIVGLKEPAANEPDEIISLRSVKCKLKYYLCTCVIAILEDNYDDEIGMRVSANFEANLVGNEIMNIFGGFNQEDYFTKADEEPAESWGKSVLQQVQDYEDVLEAAKPTDMTKVVHGTERIVQDTIALLAGATGMENAIEPTGAEKYLTNTSLITTSECTRDTIKEQGYQLFILLRYLQDRESPKGPYDSAGPYTQMISTLNKKYDGEFERSVTMCEICRHHWEDEVKTLDPATVYRIHFTIPYFFAQVKMRDLYYSHCQERMEEVTRGNPVEKAADFLKQMRTLVHELDHMYSLVDNPRTRPLVNYSDWIQNKPFITAAASWLVIFVFYGTHEDPYGWIPIMQWINAVMVLQHLCYSCFWCATFYFVEAPMLVPYRLDAKTEPEADPYLFWDSTKPYDQPLENVPEPKPPETQEEFYSRHLSYASMAMKPIIFSSFSCMALVGPPAFRFWLFFWMLNYLDLPQGRSIKLAFIFAGPALANVLFSAALVCLCFTAFSYFMFSTELQEFAYIKYSGKVTTSETIYQTVISGFHDGMRGDLRRSWGPAEAGSTALPEYAWERNIMGVQWILVMMYLLIWNFVYLAITKAIIVGAFSAQNAKAAGLKTDLNGKCLVCSMPRFKIDQEGGGFITHTKQHHDPWGYLALLCALKLGDEDEFTGIESYVHEKVLRNDSTFIPVSMCAAIQARDTFKESKKQALQAALQDDAGEKDPQQAMMGSLKRVEANLSRPVIMINQCSIKMQSLEKKMTRFASLVNIKTKK